MDEWIEKMGYIHIMKDYSAIQKNEFLPLVTTWMDLEGIMLSEIRERHTEWSHLYMESKNQDKMKVDKDTENKQVTERWDGEGGRKGDQDGEHI